MTRSWELVKAFGRFWYGFIIGDDWTAAAGVVVLILGTYGVLALGMPAWWFGPVVVVATAALTIRRELTRDEASGA